MSGNKERTFIAIKPDGVHRGLVGEITTKFEQRGFKLVALKFIKASGELLDQHYKEHVGKEFYTGLKSFMSSSPVVAMVWQGLDVVNQSRAMLGETSPLKSKPGTIRGDYCLDMGRNLIHGSDAVETANREVALWFKPEEIMDWASVTDTMVYEK